MVQVYLTRSNLLALLNKLDYKKSGGETTRTLVKRDTTHSTYPQSHPNIYVTALEDEEYYTDRKPGAVVDFSYGVWKDRPGDGNL